LKDGYILIPDEIVEREDLTPAQKIILGVIARIQGKSAACYPSLEYIAKRCGMGRRQVIRLINDLVVRKEIVRLHHTKSSNTYSVPWATARNLRQKWAAERGKRAVS
jgi:hypothetical protein